MGKVSLALGGAHPIKPHNKTAANTDVAALVILENRIDALRRIHKRMGNNRKSEAAAHAMTPMATAIPRDLTAGIEVNASDPKPSKVDIMQSNTA
jgi:hypothetical protein